MSVLPLNGHPAAHQLQELRNAKVHTANAIYIALKHLEAAQAIATAHALPYPLGDTRAQLQSALDLVNKDISDRGNTP